MEKNQANNSSSSIKQIEKTLRNLMIVTTICALFAVAGTGFGIYATIQANRALSAQNEVEDISDDELNEVEISYGKPADAKSIDSVSITSGNTDINIFEDSIDYIYYNDDDEGDDYPSKTVETETTDIYQYIFDNVLQYLGSYEDYSDIEEVDWSVDVSTINDEYSYAAGVGEAPEWFKALMNKIESKQ